MITIFTNIKDEHRYLKQWIDYHINLGFEEFILFEDEGSKSHENIIMEVTSSVPVLLYQGVLKNDSKEFKDLTCFKFVFQNHPEITWGIKLDPDEYLDLGSYKTIQEYIEAAKNFCKIDPEYTELAEVAFNWHLHNANGLVYPPVKYRYDLMQTYPNAIDPNVLAIEGKNNVSENGYDLKKTLMRFTYFEDRSDNTINANISEAFPHRLLNTISYVDAEALTGAHIKHYLTKSFDEYFNRLSVRGEYSPQWYRKLGDFFVLNPDMIPLKHELELIYDIKIDTFETKLNVTDVFTVKE